MAQYHINYRVYTKVTASSPWRFTGIIESSKALADADWPGIIGRLRYYAYKLEACTYGVTIQR